MKIIINATNLIEDRPLREVERLINLGKGHLPNIVTIKLSPTAKELIKKYDDEFKVMDEKFLEEVAIFEPAITYEDLDELNIFREIGLNTQKLDQGLTAAQSKISNIEEVTDIDVIEPIPIDHYVDFEEPKEVKPIKKAKKK